MLESIWSTIADVALFWQSVRAAAGQAGNLPTVLTLTESLLLVEETEAARCPAGQSRPSTVVRGLGRGRLQTR